MSGSTPWDGKMSSNSFTWITEGGNLGTADWGGLAGRCASLCLQAARGGRAAGGSGQWQKHIRGVFATMRYTNWRPLPFYLLLFCCTIDYNVIL